MGVKTGILKICSSVLCACSPSELMVTESSHLRTLRVLDLIFYQRMRKESLLPREELVRLFPNLPELIEIHSEEPLLPLPNLGAWDGHPL